jgi:putative transposase
MKKYNPQIHHRRSIRLKGYDYSQAGLYFITICCKDRAHLFGKVVNGEMVLNDAGEIAQKCWLEIPNHFPNVVLHEYVIMPNHVHGIVEFVGANNDSPNDNPNPANNDSPNDNPNPANNDSPNDNPNRLENDSPNNNLIRANSNRANSDSPLRSPSKTIGSVVRGFKIGVTKWLRENTDVYDVWQRNYYEHIIRNEKSHQIISDYIINNPAKWNDDKFYTK